MKVFLITVPKAGTYLLSAIMQNMGVHRSHLHISDKGHNDYSRIPFEIRRKDPGKSFTEMPLAKSLSLVRDGSFAVGHLRHTAEAEEALQPFRLLFAGRKPKDTLLSRMLFLLESGRAHRWDKDRPWVNERNPGKQFLKYLSIRGDENLDLYSRILPWMNRQEVECFDFDHLKEFPYENLVRLSNALELNCSDEMIQKVIDSSFGAKTLTHSSVQVDRSAYWTDEAHDMIDILIKKYNIHYTMKHKQAWPEDETRVLAGRK